MNEPNEYVGTVSEPIRTIKAIITPQGPAYAANSVFGVDPDGKAFNLPCFMLGRGASTRFIQAIVREKVTTGSAIKAALSLKFVKKRSSYTPPPQGSEFKGPADMEEMLGDIDIPSANYKEVKGEGSSVVTYAYAVVTLAVPFWLTSADDLNSIGMVPVVTGTPDFAPGSLVTIELLGGMS